MFCIIASCFQIALFHSIMDPDVTNHAHSNARTPHALLRQASVWSVNLVILDLPAFPAIILVHFHVIATQACVMSAELECMVHTAHFRVLRVTVNTVTRKMEDAYHARKVSTDTAVIYLVHRTVMADVTQ